LTKEKQRVKGPAEFDKPVDLKKVKLDVIKHWIVQRLTELLGGVEDEVLCQYTISLLEGTQVRQPNLSTGIARFI